MPGTGAHRPQYTPTAQRLCLTARRRVLLTSCACSLAASMPHRPQPAPISSTLLPATRSGWPTRCLQTTMLALRLKPHLAHVLPAVPGQDDAVRLGRLMLYTWGNTLTRHLICCSCLHCALQALPSHSHGRLPEALMMHRPVACEHQQDIAAAGEMGRQPSLTRHHGWPSPACLKKGARHAY